MSSSRILTFQQALDKTQDIKRHLLLGNGFSIALFPDRFRYGSLLDEADFSAHPQARQAFDALGTTDFEVVIHALKQAVTLLPLYGGDATTRQTMTQHAEALKELLVQAIAGKHPERPSDITGSQYQSCRAFLAHFGGESRNLKPTGGKDLRGCYYSLNYDMLLYWTLLHAEVINWNSSDPLASIIETTEKIDHDDGFRAPDDDPDAAYVTWDGEEAHSQSVFYLHGALHLYDHGHELQKKCWERSGGIPLIDQIRLSLSEGRFPLFVSEGNSKGKYERIRHAGYLHKSLRSFAEICRNKTAVLFIFGHSLAENDAHILKQIEKGKVGCIYISLFGSPTEPYNKAIIQKAKSMQRARSERYPLEVNFYDAVSANVWGQAT